ncbi:Retrovirusrelated Pol Polyprotein from transposon 297 [Phytophthora megakarya]|uniref:Retrovirusrelated Pol Polyprotein from transposon 297 n=1 Tax=Phytophthora megakarya TaxID=4795 RepID=A0A225X0I9_9STRA|nr:Retrovirusrelated Pol Polyprotein from transposon 297 [Phytophthora megakarya]
MLENVRELLETFANMSPPRKYAPLQAKYIRKYVKALVADGFVQKNNSSRWAVLSSPVYTPKRVPQGAMDSALHFQAQMQTLLDPLIPHSALVWMDDVILFATWMDEFREVLRKFFTFVAEAYLVLNMAKRSLFELEIM